MQIKGMCSLVRTKNTDANETDIVSDVKNGRKLREEALTH
jgi:hypothetical protein